MKPALMLFALVFAAPVTASGPGADESRAAAAIADPAAFAARARALAERGEVRVALHVIDLLALGTGSDEITTEARALKAELCRQAAALDTSYVSQSLYLNGADVLDRANAEANIDAYPLPRSSDLTVDLLTKAATIPAATLLAADIGQRIAVSGLPAEAPGETEFYIENIADKITTSGWERTFTVSPRADYWTLQDATYGALDSTFVLAF